MNCTLAWSKLIKQERRFFAEFVFVILNEHCSEKSIIECLGESVLVVWHLSCPTVEDGCYVVPSARAWLAFVVRTEWSARVPLAAAVAETQAVVVAAQ